MTHTLFQQSFANVAPPRAKVDWSRHARTCYTDETQLLRDMMHLYLQDAPFDADVTYSKGNIWKGLPEPIFKSDLNPPERRRRGGVVRADARDLWMLADESQMSVMFDPPFVVKNPNRENARLGKIENRFSGFKNVAEMFSVYRAALVEFKRVLKPRGIVAFKCQDGVAGGKQVWASDEVIAMARELDYVLQDKFILHNDGALMWSPNMEKQQHARKNHCYYLVFRKK